VTAFPRVLDLSTSVGSAYTARVLADAGWDVVRLTPAAGDSLADQPSRWGGGEGGARWFTDLGKRVLEPAGDVDGGLVDVLSRLAAAADVVVADLSPAGRLAAGLDRDAVAALRPRLVRTSVSPFGATGPKAEWAATELVMQAASGLMFLTGEWDQPPMQLPPYQAEMLGGVAAASATVAAVLAARLDGRRHAVDVAMVEALAGHGYTALGAYLDRGEVLRREQRVRAGLRMVPASDGFVYCAPGALATMRMDGIATLIDEPRLAEERFQTAEGRMQHQEEFLALFVPPFRRRTAQEWFQAAAEAHMTFALVQSIDDLFGCPQMAARQLFVETARPDGTTVRTPGRAYRLEGSAAADLRPVAPRAVSLDEVLADWAV